MHARLQPTYRESGGQSHYEYHAQSHQMTQDGLENTGKYNDFCSCQLYHLRTRCGNFTIFYFLRTIYRQSILQMPWMRCKSSRSFPFHVHAEKSEQHMTYIQVSKDLHGLKPFKIERKKVFGYYVLVTTNSARFRHRSSSGNQSFSCTPKYIVGAAGELN